MLNKKVSEFWILGHNGIDITWNYDQNLRQAWGLPLAARYGSHIHHH